MSKHESWECDHCKEPMTGPSTDHIFMVTIPESSAPNGRVSARPIHARVKVYLGANMHERGLTPDDPMWEPPDSDKQPDFCPTSLKLLNKWALEQALALFEKAYDSYERRLAESSGGATVISMPVRGDQIRGPSGSV
jgi:hypothetical protein